MQYNDRQKTKKRSSDHSQSTSKRQCFSPVHIDDDVHLSTETDISITQHNDDSLSTWNEFEGHR